MSGKGMGGHHRPNEGLNDEWLTPPWPMAERHYTALDMGLLAPWDGFIWCNPPYGGDTWQWLARLADHPEGGIALIFARTETAGFASEVWEKASALYFLTGRLFFHHVTGERAKHNSGAPSVLVAYGDAGRARLLDRVPRLPAGFLVETWRRAAA